MKNYMNMSTIDLSNLSKDELTDAWKKGYLSWDKMSQADDIRWEREVSSRQHIIRQQNAQIAMQNSQIAMQQAEQANRIAMELHQNAVDAANQAVLLHNMMFFNM